MEPVCGERIKDDADALRCVLYWEWVPQRGASRTPYETTYSVKIEFIEQVVSEETLKKQPVTTKPALVRQSALIPWELRNGNCAKAKLSEDVGLNIMPGMKVKVALSSHWWQSSTRDDSRRTRRSRWGGRRHPLSKLH